MVHQPFIFKQFTIRQDKCAMKVGTDAVLLGAWIKTKNAESILDIGTGTGVIAIMLAQKSFAAIDALDIEVNAYLQAKENAEQCNWNSRITVYHSSVQDFLKLTPRKYDLIVSNPPYFIDSSKSAEEVRTHARHNDLLSFQELIDSVVGLLNKKGRFCVILPNKEAALLRKMAEAKGLTLSKLLRVRTKENQDTEKRHIMQFEFNPEEFSEETIVIEKDGRHEYTEEYKELTKEYYINF